jgi:hypothetical protein
MLAGAVKVAVDDRGTPAVGRTHRDIVRGNESAAF